MVIGNFIRIKSRKKMLEKLKQKVSIFLKIKNTFNCPREYNSVGRDKRYYM